MPLCVSSPSSTSSRYLHLNRDGSDDDDDLFVQLRNSHHDHRNYNQCRLHFQRHIFHQGQHLPNLELKMPLLTLGALNPRLQSLYTHLSSSCCLSCPPSTRPPPPLLESCSLKGMLCLCRDNNQKHRSSKHCRCRHHQHNKEQCSKEKEKENEKGITTLHAACQARERQCQQKNDSVEQSQRHSSAASCRCRHHQHNKEQCSKEKEKENEKGITTLHAACQARERQCQQKNDTVEQSQRHSSAASWKWQKRDKLEERKEEERKEEVKDGKQSRDPKNHFFDYPRDFNLCAFHCSAPSPIPPSVLPTSPPPAYWRPDEEKSEDGQALVRGLEEEVSKLFSQRHNHCRRQPPTVSFSPSPSALIHRKHQVLRKLSTLASPTTSPMRQQEKRMRRKVDGYEGPPWVPP